MYIRIAFSIELRLRVSRSLRSLANKLVMCSVSTNGERAGKANMKLTIDFVLECSYSVKNVVDRLC